MSVFLCNTHAVDIFNSLLTSQTQSDVPTQQLSYDTTFNLGYFYVSVLFRETEFLSKPVIPLAYLIHERKRYATNDVFFRCLKSMCPNIDMATNVVMITDNEFAIIKVIKCNFPSLKTFLCWNHTIQDCKRWLRKHGVSTAIEMTHYFDSIKSLLQSTSFKEYTDELRLETKWSQPFTEFFPDYINPSIDDLGAWVLCPFGLDAASTIWWP